MEHGCNVSATNNDGNTPMHLAAAEGKKNWIKNGMQLNQSNGTEMFLGHYEVVELLWKKGVNLHIKNDSEEEPLAMAEKLSKILKKIQN